MINHWQLLVNFPIPLVNWWLVKHWLPMGRKLPMLWLVMMYWQFIGNHWTTVCWYLVHRQTCTCSYSTLILGCANYLLPKNFAKNSNPTLFFFTCEPVYDGSYFLSFFFVYFIPLRTNQTKWSNTYKQFVSCCQRIVLSVFDHFVGLAFKRLNVVFVYNGLKQSLILFWKN